MIKRCLFVFLFLTCAISFSRAATNVQIVKSPGGIEAWLVHEPSIPLIAMDFAFRGAGSTQDPQGKDGLVNFLSGMLDEGAGEYDSKAFQKKLQELAIGLSFSVSRDAFSGSLKTQSVNRKAAFDLLRLALNKPRFESEAVERIREQIIAGIRLRANQIDTQGVNAFYEQAFAGHPYARRTSGTEDSVKRLTRADLQKLHAQLFARANLKIAVVGDITAQELGPLLDEIFGALPAAPTLQEVAQTKPQGQGKSVVLRQKSAQTFIMFGAAGPKRHDPDFMASFVFNHMLGGGTFSSRLYKEVREKRGLTYGIDTWLDTYDRTGLFTGSFSTRNDAAAEALQVISNEFFRFIKEGPTDEELANAKSYLIGSYPLRFDTTSKISGLLLGLQLDDFTPAYLTEREGLINAVTLEQVKAAGQKILSQPLLTVVVGEAKGVEAK